jgi:hypothetical protein
VVSANLPLVAYYPNKGPACLPRQLVPHWSSVKKMLLHRNTMCDRMGKAQILDINLQPDIILLYTKMGPLPSLSLPSGSEPDGRDTQSRDCQSWQEETISS